MIKSKYNRMTSAGYKRYILAELEEREKELAVS